MVFDRLKQWFRGRQPQGDLQEAQESLRDSERQFAALVQHVPGAIYRYREIDGVWTCSFMSPAIEEITGYTADYFTGRSTDRFRDLVHPDDLPLFDGGVGSATDQGDDGRFEYRITARNGVVRWIGARGSDPVIGPDGEPFIDGVIYEVTRQREAEVARQRSEATFRHLFESMAEGYLVSDLNGTISLVNAAAVRILRYPDDATLRRRPAQQLFVDRVAARELLEQVNATGRLESREASLLRYDGTIVTLELNARLTGEADESVLETTFRDVTFQRQAQQEIENARRAAESANRAKSTFLANMSHELRTPMNAIIGYSEMLLEEAEDLELDGFQEDLKRIHVAGEHLLTLINDVLDLSKIEAGKMDLFVESFELDGVLDGIVHTVRPVVEKNGNSLIVERSVGLGVVRSDRTKLRQILFNLLSNAAKFTERGTVTLTASREGASAGDRLTLQVADTGVGIPADKLESIFDEFSQADSSTTRDYGGTGLGLAITRRFCDMLGGSIAVDSRPGEGSTFTIEVPAEVQAPGPAAEGSRDSAGVAAGSCILIVDDDPTSRDLIRRSLEKDGHEVVEAGSGEEGLRLAHELRPRLITLDVLMPGMDGWEVLRELKSVPALADTPIVMISVVDGEQMGLTLGATDFVSKPIDRERLSGLLRRHCLSSGSTVLIVDDEPDVRDLERRGLEKGGFGVMEAGNGAEALERLTEATPALVLLDLMMPVMDGFEFLEKMRAQPEWREIPVIVVSAKDLSREEREYMSGKVEQIVAKGPGLGGDVSQLVGSLLAGGD